MSARCSTCGAPWTRGHLHVCDTTLRELRDERDRLKAITQIDSSHLCDLLEEALTVLDDVAARWQGNLPSRIRKAVIAARAALEKQQEERLG